jgi:glycosyltransferase involved in cell wall biosynthesis
MPSSSGEQGVFIYRPNRLCRKTVTSLPPDFTLLQVVPELETGGAEQTTLDIARAVVRAGGRALVASGGGRMASRLKAAGGVLVTLPMQSKNPLTIARNGARLASLVKREKVSLIHARSRAPAFSAFIASRLTGIPFLATYHGVYAAKGRLKHWYNGIMTRGPLTIANSAYTRDRVIAEHGLDPQTVIAIDRGVDLDWFDPASVTPQQIETLRGRWRIDAEDKRVKFILAGRLTRWKGQRLIIDAATRLKAAGGREPLILLVGDEQGRYDYRAELEVAIRSGGLEESVLLVGHCDDMPAAYLIADYALAPSLEPEPFGRTAVEPQAMGRPVLAADHGAARETVVDGETGWLVAPGDAAAWADALAKAIAATPAKRARMGAAASARARRLYSVDAMCEATLNVYARIVGSS